MFLPKMSTCREQIYRRRNLQVDGYYLIQIINIKYTFTDVKKNVFFFNINRFDSIMLMTLFCCGAIC